MKITEQSLREEIQKDISLIDKHIEVVDKSAHYTDRAITIAELLKAKAMLLKYVVVWKRK